ncbi:twin-arginine translocase subunit TatC [Haloarchaeobius sp. HME9146]|uniref:twin-arginine translocase subunit TatC n=1 Tax=Haloarchaeobius sp. HME9146 TaxID=2978732 RepID=UPI0021BE648D|nr:twin-arginine translocase subunit TatC [Haloarchaeobius sp. HME9146]MCT9095052.1 twin-arginine translocase subunit TatC [Haloarchaeobius sp. HME9146]
MADESEESGLSKVDDEESRPEPPETEPAEHEPSAPPAADDADAPEKEGPIGGEPEVPDQFQHVDDAPDSGDADAPADGTDHPVEDDAPYGVTDPTDVTENPPQADADGGEDVPVGHATGAARPAAESTVDDDSFTEPDFGYDETVDDFERPPDDEEMPLAVHIEEMVSRLGIVIIAAAAATALSIFASEAIITTMWFDLLPSAGELTRPRVYSPLEFILTKIKVASLSGIVVALPLFVYESYLFMRPGLYPKERRYYLASVPTSLILAVAGMAFAYFLVLPALFEYFLYYTEGSAEIAFALSDTFNLIITLMAFQAIVFQIPLFIMLAIMMGVTSRRWLESKRILFWGAFVAIAFVFAPDPTGMAPIIIALSMVVLFEGTLLLLRWTDSSSPIPTAEEMGERRPYIWLLIGIFGYAASAAPVPDGYYQQLPAAVTDNLALLGLGNATPFLLSAAVVFVYELVAYTNKNYYGSVKLWRALRKGRPVVWLTALLAGYLGTQNSILGRVMTEVALPQTEAIALTVGLVVLFEASLFIAKRRA